MPRGHLCQPRLIGYGISLRRRNNAGSNPAADTIVSTHQPKGSTRKVLSWTSTPPNTNSISWRSLLSPWSPQAPRRRRVAAAAKAEPALTEKGRKVLAYVKAHFSDSHWKGLGKILGVVLGDEALAAELEKKTNGDDETPAPAIPGFWDPAISVWTKGAAVVPLRNTNDHNYRIGEVIIMNGDGLDEDGDNFDGEQGFQLDESDGQFDTCDCLDSTEGAWRPATATEVRAFFKKARAGLVKSARDKSELPW